MTNTEEKIQQVVKEHTRMLHQNTSNCLQNHEGELWMSTDAAELVLEECVYDVLDAIIEEMEQQHKECNEERLRLTDLQHQQPISSPERVHTECQLNYYMGQTYLLESQIPWLKQARTSLTTTL